MIYVEEGGEAKAVEPDSEVLRLRPHLLHDAVVEPRLPLLQRTVITTNYYLSKEQHGHRRRYERGQMMTFVYYREKNSALFGTP